VSNLELRFPLFGTETYGLFSNPYLPVDLVGFVDAGVAWTKRHPPNIKFAFDSDTRIPVFSAGMATRINVLGFLVMEVYYAVPFQHTEDHGHFGFQILPGW
jgi:hypothetical protein